MKLPSPFDTFEIEKKAGEYKDFGTPAGSSYPLRGVTYPVDYGEIDGYTAEDGAKLDVFLGTREDGLLGYIRVQRPELASGEIKLYLFVTEFEKQSIINTFRPVILDSGDFSTLEELLKAIEPYKDSSD